MTSKSFNKITILKSILRLVLILMIIWAILLLFSLVQAMIDPNINGFTEVNGHIAAKHIDHFIYNNSQSFMLDISNWDTYPIILRRFVRFMTIFPGLVNSLMFVIVLYLFLGFIRNLEKHEFYIPANIKKIRWMGAALIIGKGSLPIIHVLLFRIALFLPYASYKSKWGINFYVSVDLICVGLGLLLFADILNEARKMEEEQRLTI